MCISSLDDTISSYNQVQFLDGFVEFADLSKLGFAMNTINEEG